MTTPMPNGAPFVIFDCAVANAVERRLFGAEMERSGADSVEHISESSAVYQALGGTLVLRNLPDLSDRLQVRLARILRDGEVLVIATGKVQVRPVDLRPIAVLEPVEDDRVNAELRRRLSQTTITMPPLRERREDLPALVRYLLMDICGGLNLPPKRASSQAIALMAALPWRGNLQELEGLLRVLVLKVQAADSSVGRARERPTRRRAVEHHLRRLVEAGTRALRARVCGVRAGAAQRPDDRRGQDARDPADELVSEGAPAGGQAAARREVFLVRLSPASISHFPLRTNQMKRFLAVTVVAALLALTPVSPGRAQAQLIGVITGTAAGPAGPLAGVTVNVMNAAGQIVGTTVTTTAGTFSVSGLAAGTFSVNVVSATGAVLSTSTATLAAGAMTACAH